MSEPAGQCRWMHGFMVGYKIAAPCTAAGAAGLSQSAVPMGLEYHVGVAARYNPAEQIHKHTRVVTSPMNTATRREFALIGALFVLFVLFVVRVYAGQWAVALQIMSPSEVSTGPAAPAPRANTPPGARARYSPGTAAGQSARTGGPGPGACRPRGASDPSPNRRAAAAQHYRRAGSPIRRARGRGVGSHRRPVGCSQRPAGPAGADWGTRG